jgi:hypothetical protein
VQQGLLSGVFGVVRVTTQLEAKAVHLGSQLDQQLTHRGFIAGLGAGD